MANLFIRKRIRSIGITIPSSKKNILATYGDPNPHRDRYSMAQIAAANDCFGDVEVVGY